ncbi:multicopper oxidase domain-containing protein [Mechercharimyces sp. CAU 1602]|uniref:multicopper oxidase domain-containing protein n=1 Tax=Mechercharimyces sp. CAU 1602 TaxID=2973933 RepID=UPI0021618A85|nr:multicopper oxidase domain-containing protein [Mechercharimyces sp. CAU 1602]MCS1352000.1 multicopper oxidase domain-containing protein [Mechercharimyces sp. CAU 1602]
MSLDKKKDYQKRGWSRRHFLKAGIGGVLGTAGAMLLPGLLGNGNRVETGTSHAMGGMSHGSGDHKMDPNKMTKKASKESLDNAHRILKEFDYGEVEKLEDGRTLRKYTITAMEKEVEIAPGVFYPAWTYNGQVPGPTLRATEGDLLRITFQNSASHPHTIHFHGIHPGNMDGVYEIVYPGKSFTYEFTAEPFGCHLYHCHVMPLKKHMEKGMYGAFIIDPKEPREEANEMVMVMNAFDTDFDEENEFYTVNGFANAYMDRMIDVKVGEKLRIYLVNVTEFDLINSFHIHGNLFKLFRTGTQLDHYEFTDTVMLCQGERSVLEMSFKFPGKFMFHAHQSEFSELGWMGVFNVKE